MEHSLAKISNANFEFINVTGSSGRERRKNNYLARVHAAKNNRQNHKVPPGNRRASHTPRIALLPKSSCGLPRCSLVVNELSNFTELRKSDEFLPLFQSEDFHREDSREETETSEHCSIADVVSLTTPSSISPAYGGLAIDTFDWNAQPISAWLGQYLLKVSWPARNNKEIARAWFSQWCTTPLIFHVCHVAGAVHHDLLVGEAAWSTIPEVLTHKAQAIQIVNEQLGRLPSLDKVALDQLIFAIITLSRHELEPKHLETEEVLLFSPHIPLANGMKTLGRMNCGAQATAVLVQLIKDRGGLDKLQILGLADTIALKLDILESSCNLSKPLFPCYWPANINDLRRLDIFGLLVGEPPGCGFEHVPGGLPHITIVTLIDLAFVDRMMARHEYISTNSILPMLLAVRNATVHRLLSLPAWEKLDDAEKIETNMVTYQVCRIASILYSNAVVLGIPPHNGWHRGVVEKLRTIIEVAGLDHSTEDTSGFLTWVLLLAGIASYRTPHRHFFENALRAMLLKSGLRSWWSVHAVVGQFLWADSACEHGAAALWDAMDLKGHWSKS